MRLWLQLRATWLTVAAVSTVAAGVAAVGGTNGRFAALGRVRLAMTGASRDGSSVRHVIRSWVLTVLVFDFRQRE